MHKDVRIRRKAIIRLIKNENVKEDKRQWEDYKRKNMTGEMWWRKRKKWNKLQEIIFPDVRYTSIYKEKLLKLIIEFIKEYVFLNRN